MESEVEVPRGLIRTWKMWIVVALTLSVGPIAGWFGGHQTARVVTREVTVEAPPTACIDVIVPISSDPSSPIACTHPLHHGVIEKHTFRGCDESRDVLRCSCPQPTLEIADAGAHVEAGAR